MHGLILAAGMGKRLKNLTKDNTKCMVPVNGITLIERCLRILDRKNLSKIIIVTGYEGQKLQDFIGSLNIQTPIVFIDNPIYDKTNNIYSLSLATSYMLQEDTLLLESDLIFEERLIDTLLADPRDTLALVDKFESWMDGTCTVLDSNDCIVDFIPGKYLDFTQKEQYFKTVNIYKFSQHFSQYTYIPFLEAYAKAMGNNEYYESVIKLIAMLDTKEIRAKRLNGERWYEIDDIQDLDIAETLFAGAPALQYTAISHRFGGYWRYPKLIDFCYLVNPYFPPAKMISEMQSNFQSLLTQYPSGMRVNALLAEKDFGINQEHIVVGNGAAELIKCLLEYCDFNTVGFIRPTFEEYPNRFYKQAVFFDTAEQDFTYTADTIIKFYKNKEIDALVLINPDNPTGNYLSRNDIDSILSWCKQNNIALVLDESFLDFADEPYTLLTEDVLSSYDKLYLIKSISKSYGVPGLRLGILASGNTALISVLKNQVSIWNINSFGEFFMQILSKYQKDYLAALEQFRISRKQFVYNLEKISWLKVYHSQANYVMCEITHSALNSEQLCAKLLQKNILIKDLTSKIGNGKQYIRLAIRTTGENELLVHTLQMIGDC